VPAALPAHAAGRNDASLRWRREEGAVRAACALPCVAVFGDGVVAVVKLTVVVTGALLWRHAAIHLRTQDVHTVELQEDHLPLQQDSFEYHIF